MKLYHGSNVKVVTPLIRSNLRALDFGPGFYLTTSKKQATTWAKSVTRRRRNGIPTLNIYNFESISCSIINTLHFETPNADWLDFVSAFCLRT